MGTSPRGRGPRPASPATIADRRTPAWLDQVAAEELGEAGPALHHLPLQVGREWQEGRPGVGPHGAAGEQGAALGVHGHAAVARLPGLEADGHAEWRGAA